MPTTYGPADPLAGLLALPEVEAACGAARAAIDAVLWDRRVRARMGELTADARLRGAWASAALDGAELAPEAVRDGSALDGSPMGQVLAASLRLQEALPGQVAVFERAPLQAWAALHALTAHGFLPADALGRPRTAQDPDDPLHLGAAPPREEMVARLDALGGLLTRPTAAPAVLVAAVVHGELLALRPFAWGSALLARASVRLVLASRGVDPDAVTVPEAGVLARGRPAYVSALRGYLSGTADGVARWLCFHADTLSRGAQEALIAVDPG